MSSRAREAGIGSNATTASNFEGHFFILRFSLLTYFSYSDAITSLHFWHAVWYVVRRVFHITFASDRGLAARGYPGVGWFVFPHFTIGCM